MLPPVLPRVLPAAQRLTRAESFREVTRHGRRSGARTLVLHLAPAPSLEGAGVRAGFVVSKAVGNAVVRNRVRRRLRHLVRDRLPGLEAPSAVVVRALPAAADASTQELAVDLDRCWGRVLGGSS